MIDVSKKIKRKLILKKNEDTGNINLVPDLSISYNIKLNLINSVSNVGVLTTLDDNIDKNIYEYEYNLTGTSTSRLNELKNYKRGVDIEKIYYISDGLTNGIILTESNENRITYIIDGIKYVDDIINNITIFNLKNNNKNNLENNFQRKKFIKDENMDNYVDLPIINNNIFLERPNRSILGDIYRLNDINSMIGLTSYGGNYFNIKNNI